MAGPGREGDGGMSKARSRGTSSVLLGLEEVLERVKGEEEAFEKDTVRGEGEIGPLLSLSRGVMVLKRACR